ncbi:MULTISPECIES: class I SAM-dependent methyltransferase [Natrialbaceae]|uniref:class I SAM-dependent methyltransferase n=1 Tax=Natrialbaceae TaxID=1644061 RepID=UPI00207C312E|nr:class I SAM-dependent methyltransferase [Natronococcus sp. CG52]
MSNTFKYPNQTTRESKLLAVCSDYTFDRILDVGCGDGELTMRIGEACNVADVFGIDISRTDVKSAQNRGVNAVLLDVDREGLPFENETFDGVHSGEVFDYIKNDSSYFREIHRVLKPGGIFIISIPNLASLHNRLALLVGEMPFPLRPQFDCCYSEHGLGSETTAERVNVLTHGLLQETVRRHGFAVRRVVGCGVDTNLSFPKQLFDNLCARYPPVSYRNILVCEKIDDELTY